MDSLVGKGNIIRIWNASNTSVLRFQQEIWHTTLNEHKVITAPDVNILINKVNIQIDSWTLKWESMCKKKQEENLRMSSAEDAVDRTLEAEKKLQETENILLDSLLHCSVIRWDELYDFRTFNLAYPEKPVQPKLTALPTEPDRNWLIFQPKIDMLSRITVSKKKAIAKAENDYSIAWHKWREQTNSIVAYNNSLIDLYNQSLSDFSEKVIQWNTQKEKFIDEQNKHNTSVDDLKLRYYSFDVEAIEGYCKMVIGMSNFPDYVQKKFEVEYNPNSKILIVDFSLPSSSELPRLKEVKYISTRSETKEVYYNDAFMDNLFDSTIYKLTLRVIHEEFEADVINAIEAVSFNGWINYLDKATGNHENICIVSIQVQKEGFNYINLSKVDPKICFKSLKGIGSSKLSGIIPIRPILTMNKNDKRFVASHDVTKTFDDSTNLAAIPWEEFEHLIREIFEKEFSTNGGEVKVTQASRDGGVDAIAYDPDPIRGGKIVIQAKRYTNTVGVSAVRDLYGTVMNEGAIKGILVTTADYGPDAYAFAENKPLTLLNGGNLLHMLEKQGHKAKIDLREAKALNIANGY